MKDNRIYPCPFCGEEARTERVVEGGSEGFGGGNVKYRIKCGNKMCIAPATDLYASEEMVIFDWNTRNGLHPEIKVTKAQHQKARKAAWVMNEEKAKEEVISALGYMKTAYSRLSLLSFVLNKVDYRSYRLRCAQEAIDKLEASAHALFIAFHIDNDWDKDIGEWDEEGNDMLKRLCQKKEEDKE